MSNSRFTDSDSPKQWTILTLLQWATGYFKAKNIESPRSTAEILLAHALAVSRLDLYLCYDQPLKKEELACFKRLIQRRLLHEPVAYIIGKKEFWSLELMVSPEVLIPRPETECLVEQVLSWVKTEATNQTGHLLDLGTGSGAIVLALAKELPNWKLWAVDQSPAAIAVARQNAAANGLEDIITFGVSSWFDAIKNRGLFDVVVSNPPYIPTAEIDRLQSEISRFEPRLALDGGADGLRAIESIVRDAPATLKPGGALFLEIGWDQTDAVFEIAQKKQAYASMDLFKDYSDLDRVVRLIAH